MVRSAPSSGQPPLHLVISEKLREQIINCEYAPGEQLPSEYQLMAQFNVSRITVRRAIANLIQQGLVVSQQGKGVFVKEQRKLIYRLANPLVFFEEDMVRQGATISIQSLVFEKIIAPAEVQAILQLSAPQLEVYLQKKLLLIDGVAVALDSSYIMPELGSQFAAELQQHMTFPTLEHNGINIERIEATLECTHASYELSEYLNVSLGSPLLVYCYTAYTQDHQPVICGDAPSRGDRLCYSVSLMRH
jgi:GntR family transcriptional regulator